MFRRRPCPSEKSEGYSYRHKYERHYHCDCRSWKQDGFEINEKEAVTRLSEEILSEISRMTGGKYIRANLNTELKGIFRDPGVVGKKIFSGGKDIFQIPLTLSIVLLSLGMWFERWGE